MLAGIEQWVTGGAQEWLWLAPALTGLIGVVAALRNIRARRREVPLTKRRRAEQGEMGLSVGQRLSIIVSVPRFLTVNLVKEVVPAGRF